MRSSEFVLGFYMLPPFFVQFGINGKSNVTNKVQQMAAKRSCPECGSNDSLVSDYHVSQEQLVCVGCGYVDTRNVSSKYMFEEHRNADGVDFTSSTGSSIQHLASALKYSDNKQAETQMTMVAKARLSGIASNFGLSQEMTKEATQLFEDALIANSSFVLFVEQKKVFLAGCCVYVVSRRHGLSVAVSFVANYVAAPINVFILLLRQLTDVLHIGDVEGIDLDVMASSYLCELSTFGTDEMNKMNVTVKGLVDICKKSLIVEGVTAQPFLAAASYVAWRCVTFPPRKTSFSKFCQTSGAKCNTTSRIRLSELITLLVELSGSIPWLAGQKITKKNVLYHLETILKYRKTLVKTREADVEKPDLFYDIFGRRRKKNITPMEPSCSTREGEEIDGKDNDDIDVIPDNEMAQYLRSPAEVEYIKRLQSQNKSQ